MAIFGTPSPHVTISHYFRLLPSPCHRVNSGKLSLRIEVTKTIWGHFKSSNDTRSSTTRISTSGSVCSTVLILDVDTKGFAFFLKERNVFFWRFCIPSCFNSVIFSRASFSKSGLYLTCHKHSLTLSCAFSCFKLGLARLNVFNNKLSISVIISLTSTLYHSYKGTC